MKNQPNENNRNQVWVDEDVQGKVVWRVLVYWSACFLFVTLPLVWAAAMEDPSHMLYEHVGTVWNRHWPIYFGLFLLLPVITWDALRLSQRIAGPILRVRRQLVSMNSGQPYSELKFRGNDFWQEMAAQVNQLGRKTLS